MEKLGEYAQEESPDTETRNFPREPMLEEVTANSSELLQTVKDLKTEMESIKRENERILKAQEELNQILIEKFQTEGIRSRRLESEDVSHQRRSKKMKLEKIESSSSSEGFGERQSYHTTSDSSEAELYDRKKKYKPYEEISGEFKKIKPPTFNGETEKGEEAESWLSGMRKYFQIYNYSNQLKARMAIYNLSRKADIWRQDLKRVKGIREK